MVKFRTEKVTERVTRIYAICTELMYLVEGDEKAVLIDTGSGFGSLKAKVDSLTDKPLIVLLTHGHTDHAMGAGEFETVYMNHKDDYIFGPHGDRKFRLEGLEMSEQRGDVVEDDYIETADVSSFLDLNGGDSFDLGGVTIDIYDCPGHTKGSVVMLIKEAEEKLLLLGDACNNFTFLFEDYSISIAQYKNSLIRLKKEVEGKYNKVLASHGDGSLPIDIIDGMIELCDDIQSGNTDDIPMTFRGNSGLIAKKMGENGLRVDGGSGNIITQILGTFLAAYYTDTVGIAAAAIGTMMLLTRLLDGVSDIIMGGVIDRTNTKWGKARPWLLISAPFICIGLILTFNVPESMSSGAKLIYAYLTYIFLNCISYTAYMISHTSLLARMTLDVHDRQTMTSLNQIINNVVQLIVTGFTMVFVGNWGWRTVSIVYGIITAVMILICFFGTREHISMSEGGEEIKKAEVVPLAKAIPALVKNKYFYLLAALFILALSIASGNGSMTVYYCGNILENMDMMTPLSMALTIPVIVGNIFVPSIVQKLGHRKTLIISSVLMVAGFLIVAINPYSGTFAVIGTTVRGFGNGAIFACGFALSAQVVDYGDWKFNVRSEGLVNSCVSFGQKIGLGLGAAIASWIIAAGGYVGTAATQTEAAKASIVFAYVWYGVILAVLLLIVSIFLNIDKYEQQIKEELEVRHKQN